MEILGTLLGILVFGGIWVWLKSNQTQAELMARRPILPMTFEKDIEKKELDTAESRKNT